MVLDRNARGVRQARELEPSGLPGSSRFALFLNLDITRAVLDVRHPPDLIAAKLKRLSRLPLDGNDQDAALGS